jgi:hypothetical protein
VTGMALELPVNAKAWRLRGSWASGRRVSLTIDSRDLHRIEGHVQAVSATNAYVVIAGQHVPLDYVLAVHYPSLLGDSTFEEGRAWSGRGRRVGRPGQMELQTETPRLPLAKATTEA